MFTGGEAAVWEQPEQLYRVSESHQRWSDDGADVRTATATRARPTTSAADPAQASSRPELYCRRRKARRYSRC